MLAKRRESSGETARGLEAADGKVVGIEVKASATVQSKDLTGLSMLRDSLRDRFVGGVILHTGPRTQTVAERIVALPMDALWRLVGPL